MSRHGWFILSAYAVTAVAISALTLYVLADYRRLRAALSKYPPRESDDVDGTGGGNRGD